MPRDSSWVLLGLPIRQPSLSFLFINIYGASWLLAQHGVRVRVVPTHNKNEFFWFAHTVCQAIWHLPANAQAEGHVMKDFHGNEDCMGRCLWIHLDSSGPQYDKWLDELIECYALIAVLAPMHRQVMIILDGHHDDLRSLQGIIEQPEPLAPSSSRFVNWGFWSDPSNWHMADHIV